MLSRLVEGVRVGKYTPDFAKTKPDWTFVPFCEETRKNQRNAFKQVHSNER